MFSSLRSSLLLLLLLFLLASYIIKMSMNALYGSLEVHQPANFVLNALMRLSRYIINLPYVAISSGFTAGSSRSSMASYRASKVLQLAKDSIPDTEDIIQMTSGSWKVEYELRVAAATMMIASYPKQVRPQVAKLIQDIENIAADYRKFADHARWSMYEQRSVVHFLRDAIDPLTNFILDGNLEEVDAIAKVMKNRINAFDTRLTKLQAAHDSIMKRTEDLAIHATTLMKDLERQGDKKAKVALQKVMLGMGTGGLTAGVLGLLSWAGVGSVAMACPVCGPAALAISGGVIGWGVHDHQTAFQLQESHTSIRAIHVNVNDVINRLAKTSNAYKDMITSLSDARQTTTEAAGLAAPVDPKQVPSKIILDLHKADLKRSLEHIEDAYTKFFENL